MKLYDAGPSPNAVRVRAVANELGIELDLVPVDLRDPAAKVAALGPYNPNTKVPVLVDGDYSLWESRAIIAYLADLKPQGGLYPSDPKRRGIVDQWSYWGAVHLGPVLMAIAFERFLKPKFGLGASNDAAIAGQLDQLPTLLGILDGALAGKEWVADQISIADFGIAANFLYRKVAGIPLGDRPNVQDWIDRIEARPSWREAAAPVTGFLAG